jgi:glycine/D-amino acid oxidase-like deaminating enzyme
VRAGDAIRCEAEHLGREGVVFRYNTQALELVTAGGQVVGVKTDKGEFRAPATVIAAGAWSRRLVESVGAKCPTQAKGDTRYTTAPLGITPSLPVLLYNDVAIFYIRHERDGLLIGGEDKLVDSLNPPLAVNIPKDGAYRVREQVEPAMPVLKHAEVDVVTSAVASYTRDEHFILDAVPGAKGLYVMTACQEAGITHGPALGKMMTDLILNGHTQVDRSTFRLTRFNSIGTATPWPWMSRTRQIGGEA